MLRLFIIFITTTNILGIENIVLHDAPPPELNYPNYVNKNEESARRFIQTYNSNNPVVLLVENTRQNQDDALNFIRNVHKFNPKIENLNFMLMKFNNTDVSPVLETTKNNKSQFEQILNEKIPKNPTNSLGRDVKSAAFFGILNAVHVLPSGSGIIVFLKNAIEDEDLTQIVEKEVRVKQIQVFIVWAGKNEEHLLKQLANISRGLFMVTPIRNLSDFYYEQFLENVDEFSSVSTILSRKNLKGECNLIFPIDSDVTGIHINITPNISRGVLTTPRGYKIDVLENEDVAQFSGSFIKREGGMHEIHLNTTTATTQDVGVWSFRVDNARTLYNITILVHTKLTTNGVVTLQNLTDGIKPINRKKTLKLGLTGHISSVNNISFVDRGGEPISGNFKFMLDQNFENYLSQNIENVQTNFKKELKIDVENLPKKPFYVVVNGKDSQGHDFRRLSYVKENTQKEFYLPHITIEVGLGSELITQGLRQPQLFFEVSNNGNAVTFVRFFARDEQVILGSMNPWYKWINPQETATVRVTLYTKPGSYRDIVTLTATGSENISKKVIVDVGSNIIDDKRDPELDYQFTSDCTNILGTCEDGSWTVEVRAKDTASGLLRVSSIPKGLHFPNGFTAGTTEEVTGYFSESCCNPDLKLVAYDRQNNRKTRHINAYHANLGPGAIAAICLGVLFLILISIAIVLLSLKYCSCCKKGDRYDLPVYRGPLSSGRK